MLTFMATLIHLEEASQLWRLEPELPANVLPARMVYGSERFVRWIEQSLPTLTSDWNIQLAPNEQLAILFEMFCSGAELVHDRGFHCLRPSADGVWELKTADLRVFGWFHTIDCFIAHCADTATRVKTIGLYTGYCGEVVRFRDELDLDEPKAVLGDDPNAVVSNFRYP